MLQESRHLESEKCGGGREGLVGPCRVWGAGIWVQGGGLECRHDEKAALITAVLPQLLVPNAQPKRCVFFLTGTAAEVFTWLERGRGGQRAEE